MRLPLSKRDPFPQFDMKEEYAKLNQLFHDKDAFSIIQSRYSQQRDYYSYYDVLDDFFLQWELRKSYTSLEEMLMKEHISEHDFAKKATEEKLLDYIQFILNAIQYVQRTVVRLPFKMHLDNYSIGNAIKDNCHLVLGKLNAEAKTIDLELWVLYKNDVATAVSIQNQESAQSIVEYLKIENRDNLERKGEILSSLYKQLEPHKRNLIDNGFQQLCNDMSLLLNKTGARHALDPNDGIEAQILTMGDQERIKWYDHAFKAVLACMAVLPYLELKKEIKDIKHRGQ